MDINVKKRIIYTSIGFLILLGITAFIIYRLTSIGDVNGPIIGEGGETTGGVSGEIVVGPTAPLPDEIRNLKPGESLDVPNEQKLFRLTDFPVVSAALSKESNGVLFLKKEGGDLLSSDFTGANQTKVSNVTVLGLMEAIWSRTKDSAAIFYLDGETVKGFLHNGTSSVSVLPQNVSTLSWSPDGKSVSYILENGTGVNIVTADSSGRNAKIAATSPLADAFIHWYEKDKIAFQTAPSGLAEGFIFSFSITSGLTSRLIGPLYGLESLWSPGGTRVLVSSTNTEGKNLNLSIFDIKTKSAKIAPFKTLAEKCSFASEEEIYCAVPKNIAEGWVLPDDYLRGEVNTLDRIVYFNLKTEELREVLDEGSFDISNLLATANRDYLLFVNRIDGTLWALKLRF